MTRETSIRLPDGRRLDAGRETAIHGTPGRFLFRYSLPNGDLAFYGPTGSPRARARYFRPDRVRTIHRKGPTE